MRWWETRSSGALHSYPANRTRACSVTSASAFDVKIKGTTHPLRWGDSDQNDNVTPYAVYGYPVCLKRGSQITLSLDDPQNEVSRWRVVRAQLVSKTDATVYFTFAESPSVLHASSVDIPIGNAPDKIEHAELQVQCKYLLNATPASRNTRSNTR